MGRRSIGWATLACVAACSGSGGTDGDPIAGADDAAADGAGHPDGGAHDAGDESVADASDASVADAGDAGAGDASADAACALGDVGAACSSGADCCSGLCSAVSGVCLAGRCGAPGAACASAADCCSASCVAGACTVELVASLDDDRDRLLDTVAQIKGSGDRCAYWGALDDNQKGIFLTHTDLLGNRTCMENAAITSGLGSNGKCGGSSACRCPAGSDMALGHVFELWTINGSDPSCSCSKTSSGYNCCNGGAEWHRIFFTADDVLIADFRKVSGALPAWGPSTDLGGPHAPFDRSDETIAGQPRGQIQFWASDSSATTLQRNGVAGVLEPHIVELDNDYNLVHDSNPEGSYGLLGLFGTYGRVLYKKLWEPMGNQAQTTFQGNGEPSAIAELANDAIWAPTCPAAHVDAVGPTVERGAVVSIAGTGFADCAAHVGCGNVVHLRTRATEIVLGPGSPFLLSESSTEIRAQIPEESGTGDAYAWVVTGGVLSNLAPTTVAK